MEGKRAAQFAQKRRFWQDHLSRWESSGLSQLEFCRQNNMRINKFLYWKNKLQPKPPVAALVALPAEVFSRPPLPTGSPICLVIDSRHRIEIAPGFDADTLGRLIHFLDRQ